MDNCNGAGGGIGWSSKLIRSLESWGCLACEAVLSLSLGVWVVASLETCDFDTLSFNHNGLAFVVCFWRSTLSFAISVDKLAIICIRSAKSPFLSYASTRGVDFVFKAVKRKRQPFCAPSRNTAKQAKLELGPVDYRSSWAHLSLSQKSFFHYYIIIR